MLFLIRFLKTFAFLLVLSGIGGLVFYWLILSKMNLSADVTPAQFRAGVAHAIGYWIGVILMLSLLLAAIRKQTTLTLAIHDWNTFVYRLNGEMTKLRYRLHKQTEDALIFKPPAYIPFADKVSAKFKQNSVKITGTPRLLEKLKQKL